MIKMHDTPECRREIAARIKSEGGIRIINISPSVKESKTVRRIIIKALEAERDALVETLRNIARCSVVGYSLNGRETHSDLAEIISYLNSQLQRRVKAAEEALTRIVG